ncbi:MATE family efflux transporter [Coralliovum pocilloporae]|uniref:MATE family efflux transporter n=1 Tax=Coralliovum pocilloporae TaxID=3066369 RepID=UPI0033077329
MSQVSADQSKAFDVSLGLVLKIAVPMTIAYLSTPIVGITDTFVIGQLGDPALLGGIAVGAILFDLLFSSFNFLRSGSTGLTAQAYGAQDDVEIGAVLLRFCMTAVILGLLLLALREPFLQLGLAFMEPSPEVAQATETYFLIRILAAPFTFLNFAILGWVLGLGRAGTGLLLQTMLNGLNIGLSLLLVLVYDWGVAGAAWATFTAELVTAFAGVGLILAQARATSHSGQWPSRARLFDASRFKAMFGLNRDIMIRSFCLVFAFAYFTAQGAQSGDVVLAANAILMNFFFVAGYFLDGFATAAEQLVGRAVGARWRPAYDRTLWLTVVWGFILSGFLTAVMLVFGPAFIDTMTTSEDVRLHAGDYLIWAALTPLAGVLAFQMDGVFIGATWSRDMRNMMLLSLGLYLLTLHSFSDLWGNHALWIALLVFLGARGLSLSVISIPRARQTFSG